MFEKLLLTRLQIFTDTKDVIPISFELIESHFTIDPCQRVHEVKYALSRSQMLLKLSTDCRKGLTLKINEVKYVQILQFHTTARLLRMMDVNAYSSGLFDVPQRSVSGFVVYSR